MEISTIGREGHHDRSKKMSGFKRNYQQACRKWFHVNVAENCCICWWRKLERDCNDPLHGSSWINAPRRLKRPCNYLDRDDKSYDVESYHRLIDEPLFFFFFSSGENRSIAITGMRENIYHTWHLRLYIYILQRDFLF